MQFYIDIGERQREYVLFDKSYIRRYLDEKVVHWMPDGFHRVHISSKSGFYHLKVNKYMTFRLQFSNNYFIVTTNEIYAEHCENAPENAIRLIRETIRDMLIERCYIASLFCKGKGVPGDLNYEICQYIYS